MPYLCIVGGHLFVTGEADGCHDAGCLEFAAKEVRPAGVALARFGGSTSTKASRTNSDNFHRDMYAFKDAVDQGVKPEQVTKTAAESALKTAEAVEHGAK